MELVSDPPRLHFLFGSTSYCFRTAVPVISRSDKHGQNIRESMGEINIQNNSYTLSETKNRCVEPYCAQRGINCWALGYCLDFNENLYQYVLYYRWYKKSWGRGNGNEFITALHYCFKYIQHIFPQYHREDRESFVTNLHWQVQILRWTLLMGFHLMIDMKCGRSATPS